MPYPHVFTGDPIERMEKVLGTLMGDKPKGSQANHTPMTLDEACAYLKIKRGSMDYKLTNGDIPAVKMGRNYVFYKDELDTWTESKRVHPVPMTEDEFVEETLKRVQRRPRYHRYR